MLIYYFDTGKWHFISKSFHIWLFSLLMKPYATTFHKSRRRLSLHTGNQWQIRINFYLSLICISSWLLISIFCSSFYIEPAMYKVFQSFVRFLISSNIMSIQQSEKLCSITAKIPIEMIALHHKYVSCNILNFNFLSHHKLF